MRKKVSLTALVLCLILLLSACGGQQSPAASAAGTTAAATTAAAQPSAAVSQAPAEPEKSEEPLKLNGVFMQYNEPPHKDGAFWMAMEEEFNVDYDAEWVPTDSYWQKIDLLLASGDLPEILYVNTITRPSLLKAIFAGAFWDITPYIENDFADYPNLRDHTNRDAWNWSKVKGRSYMVPRTRGTLDVGIIIRKDWVEKLGMEMPTTIEEFAEFCVAVGTSDLDGNGKVDSVGTLPATGWFDDAFGGRDPVFNDEGGLVHFNFTDAYADTIEYFRDIYARGGIAQEFALIKNQQAEEMFMNGSLGSFTKNYWHTYRMQEEARKVDPAAETHVINYLKGPKGYANNRDLGFAGGNIFSKKNTDEEKLLKILDFMDRTASPDYFNFLVYGVEGVHWNMENGAPKATEKGLLEVTNSNAYPFCYAMDEFAKVTSPLADAAYNKAMREHASDSYNIERKVPLFAVVISDTWNAEWPKISDEFDAMYAKAVSGAISMDEFRAYQQTHRESPAFKTAFKEFAESYKDFF